MHENLKSDSKLDESVPHIHESLRSEVQADPIDRDRYIAAVNRDQRSEAEGTDQRTEDREQSRNQRSEP
jgi:hypothetical protein